MGRGVGLFEDGGGNQNHLICQQSMINTSFSTTRLKEEVWRKLEISVSTLYTKWVPKND